MTNNLTWVEVGPAANIPQQGARTLQTQTDRIAIFRTLDDQIFALLDRCPHKQGPWHKASCMAISLPARFITWCFHLKPARRRAPMTAVPPRSNARSLTAWCGLA